MRERGEDLNTGDMGKKEQDMTGYRNTWTHTIDQGHM